MAAKPPEKTPFWKVSPPASSPGTPPSTSAQMRSRRFWLTVAIVLLLNILITNVFFAPAQPASVVIPYNVFKQQVKADNVTSITSTGDAITGETKKPVSAGPGQDSAT